MSKSQGGFKRNSLFGAKGPRTGAGFLATRGIVGSRVLSESPDEENPNHSHRSGEAGKRRLRRSRARRVDRHEINQEHGSIFDYRESRSSESGSTYYSEEATSLFFKPSSAVPFGSPNISADIPPVNSKVAGDRLAPPAIGPELSLDGSAENADCISRNDLSDRVLGDPSNFTEHHLEPEFDEELTVKPLADKVIRTQIKESEQEYLVQQGIEKEVLENTKRGSFFGNQDRQFSEGSSAGKSQAVNSQANSHTEAESYSITDLALYDADIEGNLSPSLSRDFDPKDWADDILSGEPKEAEKLLRLQPSWRYAWSQLLCFAISSAVVIALSDSSSWLVLSQSLDFGFGEFLVHLPILIFIPLIFLFKGFFRIYNTYATMSDKYLRLHTGMLTMNSRTVEMETDTMLVVQVSQSPIDRILNLGKVSVGRFSRKNLEVEIPGVEDPQTHLKVIKKRIKDARARKVKFNHELNQELEQYGEDLLEAEEVAEA